MFVVLSLDRRRIVHVNVTTNPTARWTAMQLYQAFPFDEAPRFLVRDRDGVYGDEVKRAIEAMGDRGSADQSAFAVAERVLRTGCRDVEEGVPGSHDPVRGAACTTGAAQVSRLLPWGADASWVGEGCAGWEGRRATGSRAGQAGAHGWWASQPVLPQSCLITLHGERGSP